MSVWYIREWVIIHKLLLNYKHLQKSLRVIQNRGIEEGEGTGVCGGRAGGRERG